MCMVKEKTRRNYWLLYTLAFVLTWLLAYGYCIFQGGTMIWEGDGFSQHYPAFVYYGRFLREGIRSLLFEHRFAFRSFDFTIGEGADAIQALNYYVIGDPFALLSIFFEEKYAYIGFGFSAVLRLYFSGAAFSFFCLDQKKGSFSAILAGSLCYVFCYWNLLNSCRHPFFINPMIWLPMVICGVERILSNRKPYLYIFSVFLMALSNFYYFYMLVLMTAIYIMTRLAYCYRRNIKAGLVMLLRIAGFSVLGAAMAGILLLPVLRFFLIDSRASIPTDWKFFYPDSYYGCLPALFLAPDYREWVCMGYCAPSFFAVCLLFRNKGNRGLKFYLAVSLLFLLCPVFGQIFNGFSYVCNRWSFAIAFMVAYSLALFFDSLAGLHINDIRFLSLCAGAYSLFCLFAPSARSMGNDLLFPLLFLVALLIFLFLVRGGRIIKQLPMIYMRATLLCAVALSITLNSLLLFSDLGQGYVDKLLSPSTVFQLSSQEADALSAAAGSEREKEPFSRIYGPESVRNMGTLTGLPYLNYFWTISSPWQSKFWDELQVSEYLPYCVRDYNYRYVLLALSSVKYMSSKEEIPVNPGNFFAPVTPDPSETVIQSSSPKEWRIYENQYTLPLGYCYDSAVSTAEWSELNPLEKQELMLQDAVLDAPPAGYHREGILSSKKVPYSIAYQDDSVTVGDTRIVVTEPGAILRLAFDPLEDGEIYLHTEGIGYERLDSLRQEKTRLPESITLKMSLNEKKAVNLLFYTASYNQYNGREDFMTYLGNAEGTETVEIAFPRAGIYRYDCLEIYHQPTEAYPAQIAALGEKTLENVQIDRSDVSGTITLDVPRILCLSIPWSEGWTAFVDGKEAELMQANIRHMALSLDAGEHEIRLHYHTPLLREGLILSLLGLFSLGGYVIWDHSREKAKRVQRERSMI